MNEIQEEKNSLKQEILELENKKISIIEHKNNISAILSEMEKDKKYIDKNLADDEIICPVCGSIHKNSISNRYAFEMDIMLCSEELKSCNTSLAKIDSQIKNVKKQINEFVRKEEPLRKTLSTKRKEIELRDVLISSGVNALLQKARNDILVIQDKIKQADEKLNEIQSKLNSYKEHSQEITSIFNTKINIYINALSITDVTLMEEKRIGYHIKADGSDLPKAVLAYTLAYYDLIWANDDSIVFPLVIDTMLQQEQSTESIKNIFNTLLNRTQKNAQIIIATTNTHGIKFDGKKYAFLKKGSLLNEDDYKTVENTYIDNLSVLADYGVNPVQ